MTSPAPTPHNPHPDADLWILAGQSNMEGAALIDQDFRFETHERLWALDMDGLWSPAEPRMHHLLSASYPAHRRILIEHGFTPERLDELAAPGRAGTPHRAGPGFFFGRYLLELLPADRKIALLPCAHGGTTIEQWSPDRPGAPGETLYSAMLLRIRESGLKPRGMLWYQGESDAQPKLAGAYLKKFLNFLDRLRADLNDPAFPIFFVQLGRLAGTADGIFTARAWDRIRESQRLAANQREAIYLTSAVDCPLCDMIHVDLKSVQTLGERLARLALQHVYEAGTFGDTLRLAALEADIFHWFHPLLQFDYPTLTLRVSGAQGALRSTGEPSGFSIDRSPARGLPIDIWRIELNAAGPGTLKLYLNPLAGVERIGLRYGAGLNPICNITDEANMSLPAFGPLWVDYPRA